ncbi:MAG TPA: HD domain-containing protein [Methylomirabilota bacterium]|nr:HD domain-containing protein [Methylomirabilota bacterium]
MFSFREIDTKDPAAVQMEVQLAYLSLFPGGDRYFVPRAFGWAIDSFCGNYRNYQPIDALYHDFEHTLQGTLCLARILQRRQFAGARPQVLQRHFELGILAILLHDTGYLKTRDDTTGTGAKYTFVHVQRSAEFAAQLLSEKRIPARDIRTVQQLIGCTGVNVEVSGIPFDNETDRVVGLALGTADLLGQMAADDYLSKLPILYLEFAEAEISRSPDRSPAGFSSAENLMRKTPEFWERFVLPKIQRDFGGVYRFLNVPFPDGSNDYISRIEANIRRLKEQFS